MKIKITFFIIIGICFKCSIYAQSKKDQIEDMTMRFDSLGQIVISKTQNIGNLDEIIFLKKKCIDSTENYVSLLNKQFGELEENSKTSNQHYEIQLKELNLSNVKLHDSLATQLKPALNIGGTYSFGDNVEKEAVGSVIVYPLTDSSALFFLDVCRGAPSYNLGQMFGQMTIKDNIGTYDSKLDDDDINCLLKFEFNSEQLKVTAGEGHDDCGFGHAVYADNTYKRVDKSSPKYFINGEGDTIIFKGLTVEKYANIPTVKIGDQEWMASDIKTIIYNNGDSIKEAKTSEQWKKYNDLKVGCYRRLSIGTYVYNTYAKDDKRGILPPDFSLPTYEQFQQLMNFQGGGDTKYGKATKSLASYDLFFQEKTKDETTGFFTLKDIKVEADGSSGFKAVEGGYVNDRGYNDQGNCSFWWTATNSKPENLYMRIGACDNDDSFSYIDVNSYGKCGFSIRSIKQ
jgi:uncharacterized protein (TIGR02145 family)